MDRRYALGALFHLHGQGDHRYYSQAYQRPYKGRAPSAKYTGKYKSYQPKRSGTHCQLRTLAQPCERCSQSNQLSLVGWPGRSHHHACDNQ